MKILYYILLLLLPAFAEATEPHRGLTVTFIEPGHYTDVGLSGSNTDNIQRYVLDTLKDYLGYLADNYLPGKHTLAIKILDVDMAGAYEPWRGPMLYNTRIIRDIYPPRIKLHYVWKNEQGELLAEADEDLSELAYLQLADPSYIRNDPLRYEKTLLKRWFVERFRAPPK